MKIWLLLLNLLLAGGVAHQAVTLFRNDVPEVEYTVGKDRSRKTKETPKSTPEKSAAMTPREAAGLIIGANIFNLTRCPDAQSGRWGGNSAQMSLLGVYRIGSYQGAIIHESPHSVIEGKTTQPLPRLCVSWQEVSGCVGAMQM